MASVPVMLILSVFLAINVKAQEKYSNTIPVGSRLSPINAKNISWSSPSGVFAFGFYPQGNGFAVGIWLQVNQTNRIIVWTANRDDPPVPSSATLELTRKSGLILRTEQHEEDKVIADLFASREISSAAMLDDGNFQLLNGSHHVEWQSFNSPTDTILGGQVLSSGCKLVSSISGSNHSSGPFSLLMQQFDGNLVSQHSISTEPEITNYWFSNTAGTSDKELHLNLSGFLTINSAENLPIFILSNGSYSRQNKSTIYRATLDNDGIFRLYSHDFTVNNKSSTVKVMWSSLQDKCEVPGLCGLNSYCQVVAEEPQCLCSSGFVFINKSSWSLGCYQNFTVGSCRDNEDHYTQRMRYNITSFKNMGWDDSSYMVETIKEEACKESCLGDCNCWVALSTENRCQKFNFPLKFGRRSDGISTTALFKVLSENADTAKYHNHADPVPPFIYQSKNRTIILILGLSLGSVACLCLALAVLSFIVYKHKYRRYKKLLKNANLGLDKDFTLQSFSYSELEQATNGFKEEKGRGTFGAVYKGVLPEGNKTIAVKRLEKVVEEGMRELRAEMTTIGRTHHRNLLQLIGFCIEGSNKLLVYEFMSNGSLADRLFKSTLRPTWRERVKFVLDVARGVFYLHEECGVHVIHCNLKAENILLDDTWTAKICDFGLARHIMPNQAKTSMGIEQTSIGYFAPEWQKNALISVKSDIYNFGVVLLEIICCRRNIEVDVSTPDEITLSNWVYTCFRAGELHKLVEDEEVDFPTLERMIKVGLWCIQEDPALRPSMKSLIMMLEGTMNIPIPPSPELLVLP